MRFKTTLGALEAFLHAVETARPLLRVVALQVTPERGRSERGDDGLLVAMTVQAAARSATQVAKGAGDEG